jgi:hypothetical protein
MDFLLLLKKRIKHIYRLFSLPWNVARRKLDSEILTAAVLIEPSGDVAGDFIRVGLRSAKRMALLELQISPRGCL